MNRRLLFGKLIPLFTVVLLWIVACQPQSQTTSPTNTGSNQTEGNSIFINAAGATFPLFLYERWFSEYNKENPNIQINYNAIGSAAGIQQIIADTVDFGASDVAMKDEEINKVEKGVILVPTTAGGIAIAYNLPDIKSGLKLSRQVYTDIFLGNITRWDDPKITSINPDLNLPSAPITVIYRADGSGTTAAFTSHLSAISPEWNRKVGSGLSVEWKTGVGIKSNAGVGAQIQQASGTISYIESSYAQQLNLSTAALENKSGQYIQPSTASAAQALSSAAIPDNLRIFIPDPDGKESYPIVTYSWLLAYKNYEDGSKAKAIKDVINWGLTQGQKFSEELGYVPLPAEMVEKAIAAVEMIGNK
ncbi:MAG: phosphate ABC transporter substrate-binding protein PstS [Cyanobacteria bacterium P01_A01_bin.45]